jgi:N-acetylmuramoyl-L-alanine amidase
MIIPSPSPNFDARPEGTEITLLVLHYTGMVSGEAALACMCDPASKVSAHYMVEEDGRIFQLVAEHHRAWHAGISGWRGMQNLNHCSIGVEIVNPGHEFGYRPFPMPQMEAVAELCRGILSRHPIPPRNVVAHSDIAPTRKEDPGELFDWAWLARQGVGLWWKMGEALPDGILSVRDALAAYGYPFTSGEEAELQAVIRAFQRHFVPSYITGKWNAECENRLRNLIKLISAI